MIKDSTKSTSTLPARISKGTKCFKRLRTAIWMRKKILPIVESGLPESPEEIHIQQERVPKCAVCTEKHFLESCKRFQGSNC